MGLNKILSMQLIKRMLMNQKKVLLPVMFFAFVIEFLFTLILSTSAIRQFAESYFKLIPPMVKQLIGFMGESFVGGQLIAFGYTHPAVLFMLCFIPVSFASRYITGEIEGRSIELLALRVMPRTAIIYTVYFFTVLSIISVFLAMIGGSLFGRQIMELSKDIHVLLLLKTMGIGVLFFAAISALVILVSSFVSERGKALSWNIGIILSLFVFDAIIRIWPKAFYLKPYSLFNWYQPVNITNDKYDYVIGIPLLILIAAINLIIAGFHFRRRDL